ncbi:IS982 family transposase [Pseudactinotalea sp. HY158]|uniref:IS982 family transposase n=1 Tax=Pseudactinotalea sp. HY158 TaxID=2654547 RepID=UPI00129C79A0|nr:IS982 family transposase [Pseudactinotalea sp. HY158]QGH70236.1 IS982 family transposase [Pseudactinotalea sp. HY158]
MDADLDTLATELYVTTDDLLKAHPEECPLRPLVGLAPQISDAELITLAVMQALLGHTNETRWLRYAHTHLHAMFPYIPGQSGYNKRLRALVGTVAWLIRALASQTSVYDDDVLLVDSTPIECARSRETVHRSDLAGWAQYGYCASHSRYFWGLRLHMIATVHGLPIAFAITGAKADERTVVLELLQTDQSLAGRARSILIGDKNYFGHQFETDLADHEIELLRPARKGEKPRPGARFFKPLRQTIESIFDTFKGQLDLERHQGRTPAGVLIRILQRILALTAAIWHNDRTGQPIRRSLTAYDH